MRYVLQATCVDRPITPVYQGNSRRIMAQPSEKIPVSILTGFLGSGKTTMLNRLVRHPKMAKALVIINEFGEIGLDHELVERATDHMVLLQRGCLCCTVRSDLIEMMQ